MTQDNAATYTNGNGGDGLAEASGKPRKRIGERLLELGAITADQLEVALHEKRRSGKLLGMTLVEFGFISEAALASVLAKSAGLEPFDPKTALVDPEVVKRVPQSVAVELRALPYSMSDSIVLVAMADPYDVLAIDRLQSYFPNDVSIVPRVCLEIDLVAEIDDAYGYEMSIEGILHELDTGQVDLGVLKDDEGLTHPMVRLVNAIMLDAVKLGVSDIHFEPEELFVRLRYRIHGMMSQVHTFHKEHWPAMLQRLKIISGMNIADRFNPQDGRVVFAVGTHDIDFRVSTWPTVHGENVVMRVLDKSSLLLDLDQLGLSSHNLALLNRALRRPEGIIIAAGPTGCGKTTTLYAILNHISTPEINIMTLEEPVEYQLPLIRQAQVREGTGVSFEEGERTLLRQDPDVWFIGEVRDPTTSRMALRAAMTGHQVYTTLHTNDATAAVFRLIDLGIRRELLPGNLIAIISQRLLRMLCPECKKPHPATPEECRMLNVDPAEPPVLYEADGCGACRNTGIKGRTSIAEILLFDDEFDEAIATGGTRASIKALARKKNFRTLAEDGIERVLAGEASVGALEQLVDLGGHH